MFTGLVQQLGRVVEPTAGGGEGGVLVIEADLPSARTGDSIAVNGCCLTVTASEGGTVAFDVAPVTLQCTNLGDLQPGDPVNLEPALRAGDPLGGHLVQGHVDAVAEVTDVAVEGNATLVTLALPPDLARYSVERGSIALDGVSLTIAGRSGDSITVSVIPETRARTTFGALEPGRAVNVEIDVIARYVERLLQQGAAAQDSADA